MKSAVDRGEHRQSLLPRDAFSSLTVASQDQAVEGQAEIPGQLGRVVVTVDSKGGGGGWSILDGVGLPTCLPAHTLLAPPPLTSPLLASAGRQPWLEEAEAGLLAFPTCLKSGTPEDQVLCDLSLGQLPWSLGPEAALSRGSGLQQRLL